MISGDVIWCGVCGAYADLKVSGLTEECTGKHTGQWKGGGKRGQLNSLRKNRHPRNASQLQPPHTGVDHDAGCCGLGVSP